ncbi:MAG: hypothetical protein DCC75_11170 [Proteobacteria bacterium]|nr:MAG: hypothetical protein DCC75_11170 [Pseudomonadota bacterium]
MLSSRAFLARANQLQECGHYPAPFAPGSRVARGYADLGVEEFCVIAPDKIVSLLNGKVSEMPEQHRQFFFLVPAFSQMVQSLAVSGYDILAITYHEQRRWEVKLKRVRDGADLEFQHEEIECALADALLGL